MFRIGDFSRLARVSVKALRHYDRLGLLRPARTDSLTGYRYYSGEQLPRLNAILALKELGFSLDQISRLLDEDLSPAQIRTMLQLKRDEVRRSLEAEQERLSRIESRLNRMEREGEVPGRYEVVLKSVGAQRVASVREVLPRYSAVGKLFDELYDYAGRNGVKATAWIAVWYDEEFREEDVDGEAAFATEDPLPDAERVRPGELPAVEEMACTVHQGSFDTLGGAYAALLGWIEGNGYRVVGPNRELYLRAGNEEDNPDYVTEIQFPVEKTRPETPEELRMQKVDWRKTLKHLYVPTAKEVVEVDVPEMRFLMVDGEKAPTISDAFAEASSALYALSYALKFMVKKREAVDYGVSPLEGLWWSEEMDLFGFEGEEAMRRTVENREAWRWTAMIMQPETVTPDLFEEARGEVEKKKDLPVLGSVRFEPFGEGRSAQVLHVGPYADEWPTIERVHRFIDERGGRIRGRHHEIYLNDPTRTAPERLKTVIRQPFE